MYFKSPVKFLGCVPKKVTSKKEATKGQVFEFPEAHFELGGIMVVTVPVEGNPKLPVDGSMVNVQLTPKVDGYGGLKVVYDMRSSFKAVV